MNLGDTIMPKSYPDWELLIDVPKIEEPQQKWEEVKASFDWEPFFENLASDYEFL